MLTIVHGSDIVASRKFFLAEKERFVDAILLREDEINLTHLSQLLETGGLFEKLQTLLIEQFLTERKKSTEKEAILSYLVKQAKTHTIIFWEGKELAKTTFTPFKNANIKSFKLSSSLFVFLDAIKPKNGRQLVQLFHKSLETTEPELVFFMLIRQLRILLCMSENRGETISEVVRLASWQKGKIEKQAKLFEKDTLKKYYSQLFEIERAQKTGTLSSPLISAVDFFLVEI